MSAARVLFDLGVGIEREGTDRLVLIGLDLLSPDRAAEVLEYARTNKARLLREFGGNPAPRPIPPRPGKVTPNMLERFKVARGWLLPRLDVLLAAGWSRAELFHVGKLAWPYTWGLAWLSAWGDPNTTPALRPDGVIEWRIRELHREVVQTSRPFGQGARPEPPTWCEPWPVGICSTPGSGLTRSSRRMVSNPSP